MKLKIMKNIGVALALAGVFGTSAAVIPAYEVRAEEGSQSTQEVNLQRQLIGLTMIGNARDLGGYRTTDGKIVKKGMLLRTGKISISRNSSAEEVEQFNNDLAKLSGGYKVKTVVDLRNSVEKESAPDVRIPGSKYVDVLMDQETEEYKATEAEIDAKLSNGGDFVDNIIELIEEKKVARSDLYVNMVNNTWVQSQIKVLFDEAINSDGAVLFHCSGGKDRTGISAILLLSALGVDEQTALADFALSNDYLAPMREGLVSVVRTKTSNQNTIDRAAVFAGVGVQDMQDAINSIKTNYGSIDSYLRNQIGLTESDINTLKNKYLEEDL